MLMNFVGIDVAKDKHDCFICNSDGEVLFHAFTIPNTKEGFDNLYQKILSVTPDLSKVKVGLEATGHYSYNLLGYLLDKVCRPMLSIHYIPICIEKALLLERLKQIRLTPILSL